MGNYVYRVKAAPRKMADGTKLHESEYAYKPSWSDGRWNDEQERKRVMPAVRAWNRKGDNERIDVLMTLGKPEPGASVYSLSYCSGAFNDARLDDIGRTAIPSVGYVYADSKGKLRVIAKEALDTLVARNSAFKDFNDLANTHASYRPSIDVRDPEREMLANVYDSIMQARGDARRAYRYGGGK